MFDDLGAWMAPTRGSGRWLFAPAFIGQTTQITYWGTAPAKPVITITGLATNPLIRNSTIGTEIAMNYTVAADETVTIDTLALTVKNQAGTNLLGYTSGDLATFQLSPAPQAPSRANEILVSFGGEVAESVSTAVLTWRNRYVGLA